MSRRLPEMHLYSPTSSFRGQLVGDVFHNHAHNRQRPLTSRNLPRELHFQLFTAPTPSGKAIPSLFARSDETALKPAMVQSLKTSVQPATTTHSKNRSSRDVHIHTKRPPALQAFSRKATPSHLPTSPKTARITRVMW